MDPSLSKPTPPEEDVRNYSCLSVLDLNDVSTIVFTP